MVRVLPFLVLLLAIFAYFGWRLVSPVARTAFLASVKRHALPLLALLLVWLLAAVFFYNHPGGIRLF